MMSANMMVSAMRWTVSLDSDKESQRDSLAGQSDLFTPDPLDVIAMWMTQLNPNGLLFIDEADAIDTDLPVFKSSFLF